MTCGRTQYLEAVVSGEARAQEADLRAHAQHCTLCRHELNWLETEKGLFRQRAGREEVQQLWKGVVRRSAPASHRAWPQVLAGLAAAAALVFGTVELGSSLRQVRGDASLTAASEPNESEPLSSESFTTSGDERCSKLPSGLGFHCGPMIPASFVASR